MIWLLLGCVAEPALEYPEVTAALMGRVDLDGDGVVSAEEFVRLSLPDESLEVFDTDGDGVLSAAEVEAGFLGVNPTGIQNGRRERWMKENMPGPGGAGGPPQGGPPQGKAGKGPPPQGKVGKRPPGERR